MGNHFREVKFLKVAWSCENFFQFLRDDSADIRCSTVNLKVGYQFRVTDLRHFFKICVTDKKPVTTVSSACALSFINRIFYLG